MPDSNLPPDGLTSAELASIGDALLFFGVASSLLNLVDREFCLLSWLDLWGPTVGWAIRILISATGVACRWTAFRRSRSDREHDSTVGHPPFEPEISPGPTSAPGSEDT